MAHIKKLLILLLWILIKFKDTFLTRSSLPNVTKVQQMFQLLINVWLGVKITIKFSKDKRAGHVEA